MEGNFLLSIFVLLFKFGLNQICFYIILKKAKNRSNLKKSISLIFKLPHFQILKLKFLPIDSAPF